MALVSIYQPLQKTAQEIRLLAFTPSADGTGSIECSMQSVELTRAPRFVALSYLWGDARATRDITLNGQVFAVTTNLYDGLLAFRRRIEDTDHVWIDAICIDQSSNDEKSWQVALMGSIYSRAARVLGWLGLAADSSSSALDLIRRWGGAIHCFVDRDEAGRLSLSPDSMRSVLKAIDSPFDKDAFAALRKLLARPHWSRVWIMQELRVCLTIWRSIGRFAIEDVVDAATHRMINKATAIEKPIIGILSINFLRAEKKEAEATGKPFAPSLFDLAEKGRAAEATDPRDRIYDYSLSAHEVFAGFTAHYVRTTGTLDIVALGGTGVYDSADRPAPTLPSWVPDFGRRLAVPPLVGRAHLGYTADQGAVPKWSLPVDNVSSLIATGVVCDEIVDVLPQWESSQHIDEPFGWLWTWNKMAISQGRNLHPLGIPWRQAVFRTVLAEPYSDGYGRASFPGAAREDWFFERLVTYCCKMSFMAWNQAADVLFEQKKETGDMLYYAIADNTEIFLDASMIQNPEQLLEAEVLYWLRNSLHNSNDKMRN